MKPPYPPEFDSSEPALPPACAEAREALQRRLDGASQPETESVRDHRALCAECRTHDEAARLLLGALPNLPATRPGAGFADRVMAKTLAEPLAEPYRAWIKRRWTRVVGLVLAASVLIAVLIVTREDRKTLEPRGLVVAVPPPVPIDPPLHEIVVEKPTPLRESLQEASSAVASLTRKASAEGFGLKLPKWSLTRARVDPIGNVEPPPASLQDVRHNAAMGIAPITDSARRAFNVFWREVGPDVEKKPVNN